MQQGEGNLEFKIQNSKLRVSEGKKASLLDFCQAEAIKHHPCGGVTLRLSEGNVKKKILPCRAEQRKATLAVG
ncbi:MAG: hypothetical protein IKU22_06300 [Alistipes sp.]|nr:hypothetical protein [Alistipes sp.]